MSFLDPEALKLRLCAEDEETRAPFGNMFSLPYRFFVEYVVCLPPSCGPSVLSMTSRAAWTMA